VQILSENEGTPFDYDNLQAEFVQRTGKESKGLRAVVSAARKLHPRQIVVAQSPGLRGLVWSIVWKGPPPPDL
jgi:hypothetical protein